MLVWQEQSLRPGRYFYGFQTNLLHVLLFVWIYFCYFTAPNLLSLQFCEKLQLSISLGWASFMLSLIRFCFCFCLVCIIFGFKLIFCLFCCLLEFIFANSLLLISCHYVSAKNCSCQFCSVGQVLCLRWSVSAFAFAW